MHPAFIKHSPKLLACAFWGFLTLPGNRTATQYEVPQAFQGRINEITDHLADWQQFGIMVTGTTGTTVSFKRDPKALTNKVVNISQEVRGWDLRYSTEETRKAA